MRYSRWRFIRLLIEVQVDLHFHPSPLIPLPVEGRGKPHDGVALIEFAVQAREIKSARFAVHDFGIAGVEVTRLNVDLIVLCYIRVSSDLRPLTSSPADSKCRSRGDEALIFF